MKTTRRDFLVGATTFAVGAALGGGLTYQFAPRVVEKVTEKPVERKIKAGWIYIGPIGDYGWTHEHDVGKLKCAELFPWLETIHVESVSEGDCPRIIEQLIGKGCKVIFTTSFGFMDATIDEAKKHPDIIFGHCSGYKRAPNVLTYFAEFYQLYYLNGLMAGALTKSNKVGYVAAHLIPEVVRHINAFALGIHEVNPDATVHVRVIHEWYNPTKAREAAEALIAEGCDVLAFTEDSPTVVEVCEEYFKKGSPVYSFSHYSPMLKFGPDVCVSGQIAHWEKIYEDILMKVYLGVYTPTNLEDVDYWWTLKEEAVELGCDFGVPINSNYIPVFKEQSMDHPEFGKISIYDLVMNRLQQMSEETVLFDPFTGPIKDNEGNLRIKAGIRASHDVLWSIDWFVENVAGVKE